MNNLTIIILSFNQKNFLMTAIESCFGDVISNYELIVVDDASIPAQFDLSYIEKYIDKINLRNLSYRIFINETNLGTVRSINKVIPFINTPYFTILSGDDYLLLDGLSKTLNFIINADYDLVGGYTLSLDVENRLNKTKSPEFNVSEFNSLSPLEKYKYVATNKLPFSRGGAIFKVSKVIEVGFFDDKYDLYDDRPMYLRLSLGGAKFAKLDELVYVWRDYSGASSNEKNPVSVRFLKDLLILYSQEYYLNADFLDLNKLELKWIIKKYELKISYYYSRNNKLKTLIFAFKNFPYLIKYFYLKKLS